MLATTTDFTVSDAEKATLERDGFLVREGAFDPGEVRDIAAACETIIATLEADKRAEKISAGSYVVQANFDYSTVVKWEPNFPAVVQGIEFFAHYNDKILAVAEDPRLVDPCKAIIGEADVCLFTEKLNVKRAHHGGDVILHQDFPYWERTTPIASRVATAMLFLDDADVENGCLEVAPGSHTSGKLPRRAGVGSATLEMDPDQFDLRRMVPLEVKAGSIAYFGAYLVHRSLPNRSDRDRRALLYSYQPQGQPHLRDISRLFGKGKDPAAALAEMKAANAHKA